MKAMIWKEWRENFKWAVLPTLLILGSMALLGVPMLTDSEFLLYVHLVAGLFGAVLGFLQVNGEARGDCRSISASAVGGTPERKHPEVCVPPIS